MGELFAICSVMLFSVTNITIKQGNRRTGRAQGAFLSIVVTFILATLLWLAVGMRSGFPAISLQATVWFAIAGMLTMFLGRVFLYASIQRLGAIRGSIVKRLNPLFSVILALLFLGERISPLGGIGMGLILLSFGVLARESVSNAEVSGRIGESLPLLRRLSDLGLVYGPISALAYATGYVFRKKGLLEMPDALFGTCIGAVTGALLFVACGSVSQHYRNEVRGAFLGFNRWLFAAAVLGSLGQICYFAALRHSGVSEVALISSMEVFLTMFLSYIILGDKSYAASGIVAASVTGVLGTVLIIIG